MTGITSEPVVQTKTSILLGKMILGEKIDREQKLVFNMNVHINLQQDIYATFFICILDDKCRETATLSLY